MSNFYYLYNNTFKQRKFQNDITLVFTDCTLNYGMYLRTFDFFTYNLIKKFEYEIQVYILKL